MTRLVGVLALAGLLALPGRVGAQTSSGAEPPANAEFFLGRPRGALAVTGGWLFAAAGSDLYDFVTTQLTLSKKSFNAPVIGGALSFALTDRVDLVANVDSANVTANSEYRDFVDNRQQPIAQTTEKRELGVSASVRLALVPRGQRISRYAWIPRTLTPYVGAGAGAAKYRFKQYGSFVDFATTRVFDDTFTSDGWTRTAHVLAGADLRVYRRIYLSFEGRYTWAHATLSDDFVGFEPLDLAGLRFSSGLQLVF